MAEWEYTVVALPVAGEKTRERTFTELLNRVAAHGWRLITVTPHGAGTSYAYFERPAPSDG